MSRNITLAAAPVNPPSSEIHPTIAERFSLLNTHCSTRPFRPSANGGRQGANMILTITQLIACALIFSAGLYLIGVSVQYLRGRRKCSVGPTLQHFGIPVGVILVLAPLVWAARLLL